MIPLAPDESVPYLQQVVSDVLENPRKIEFATDTALSRRALRAHSPLGASRWHRSRKVDSLKGGHTHGPWWRYPRGQSVYGNVDGRTVTVASVSFTTSVDRNTAHANGTLIAAAPDLLAVCKSIRARFAGEGTYDAELDAAIAKAEGAGA